MTKEEKLNVIEKTCRGRIIAYNAVYTDILGSVTCGVLLSQLVYWSKKVNNREFYKTDAELRKEVMLGVDEFRRAKKRLVASGLLSKTIKGLPSKTYYLLNIDNIYTLLSERGYILVDTPKDADISKPDTKSQLSSNEGFSKTDFHLSGKLNPNTETTTKTTSKTNTEDNILLIDPSRPPVDNFTTPSSTIALTGDQPISFGREIEKRVEETYHPQASDTLQAFDEVDAILVETVDMEPISKMEITVNKSSELVCRQAKRAEKIAIENHFAEFWQKYPRKVGKRGSQLSYYQAIKKTSPEQILTALIEQEEERETALRLGVWVPDRKHPKTWLNQQCWEDETRTLDELNRQAAANMMQKMTYSQMKRAHEEANLSPKQRLFRQMAEEDRKANGGVDPLYA